MRIPDMILFDYGGTLLYEPDIDFQRGTRALFPYITKNPDHLSPEQINNFAGMLFEQLSAVRAHGFELHERQFQRIVYEYLKIELSISYEEAEIIQWDAVSSGARLPGVGNMLDYIKQKKIRTGVISNIGWSGNALQNRLDRLLPEHDFEFFIASSEYGFRKPSHMLFELALRKSGLQPEQVWFCGNSPLADVEGAAGVGVFPVWYDNKTAKAYEGSPQQEPPSCEHLHIRKWDELIEILEICTQV